MSEGTHIKEETYGWTKPRLERNEPGMSAGAAQPTGRRLTKLAAGKAQRRQWQQRGNRGGVRKRRACSSCFRWWWWWVETSCCCLLQFNFLSSIRCFIPPSLWCSFLLDWPPRWRHRPPGVETTVLILRLLFGGLQDLETAHQRLVDRHHAARVVEFTAVVWR